MKRNFFLFSFLAAFVFVLNSVVAFAQQTPPKPAAQTPEEECAELAKITDEKKAKFTEEQKKLYEESIGNCKKRADIASQNSKIQNEDKLINATLKEGNAAYGSKNYDLAIAKFDEGYNINQTYIGSAPVFLNNKATALNARASERLKTAVANNDKALKDQAKQDWNAAYEAASKALQLTKNPPAGANAEELKNLQQAKYDALVRMTIALRLLTANKLDMTKATEIKTAYQEYLAVETDAAKKTNGQMQLADLLRETGDCDSAATEYQKVLAAKADDPDALAGAGLCMFNSGVGSDNKEMMQQGMNTLTRFVEVAPDNHKLKESVKSAIEYLKTEQKIAPQKGGKSASPAKKRG